MVRDGRARAGFVSVRGKWRGEDVLVAVVTCSTTRSRGRVANVGWEVFWGIRGVERREFVIVETSEVSLWKGCVALKRRRRRSMCRVCGGHCS